MRASIYSTMMMLAGTRLFGFFTSGDIGRTGERNRYAAVGIEHDF